MSHSAEWTVRLQLSEDEGTTKARVVLETGTTSLTGHGVAHRNPEDVEVPEIGEELAAGRALNELAQLLLGAAERDIESLGTSRTERSAPPEAAWPL